MLWWRHPVSRYNVKTQSYKHWYFIHKDKKVPIPTYLYMVIPIPWKPVFISNCDIGFLVSLAVTTINGSPQRGIKPPKYPLILTADAILGCKQQPWDAIHGSPASVWLRILYGILVQWEICNVYVHHRWNKSCFRDAIYAIPRWVKCSIYQTSHSIFQRSVPYVYMTWTLSSLYLQMS